MTARQKARKAAQRASHALGLDSRPFRGGEIVHATRMRLNGPSLPKPSARKTRRLTVRASRKNNR